MIYYIVSGITLGLSAGFSPGPLMALVLSETVRSGGRAGVLVALAPLLTDLPIILLSLWVLESLPATASVYGILSLAGGSYLAWLAWVSFQVEVPEYRASAGHSLWKGVVANLLNPAPYFFWLTIGAPTVTRGWDESRIYPVLFLAGFYIFLVGAKVLLAWLMAVYRTRLSRVIYRRINMILGFMLLVLAVKFIYDGIMYLQAAQIL